MFRKRLKVEWRDKVTSINLAQCDLDNVLCKSGGLGVTNAGEVMGLAVVIFLGACQLMSIQFLGMLGFTLFLPFSLITFFALSHGVSPWCFPAIFPMCIYDDFVDISETTFTKHIVWPEGLVQRDELGRLDGFVLDCKELGFTDFWVPLEFYIQKYFNGNNFLKRRYYEMFKEARDARDKVDQMDKDDVGTQSCATINRPGALALVLLSVFVILLLVNLLPTLLSVVLWTIRTYITLLRTAIDNTV